MSQIQTLPQLAVTDNTKHNALEECTHHAKNRSFICHHCAVGVDAWCTFCGHDTSKCGLCYELSPILEPLAPLEKDREGNWHRWGVPAGIEEGSFRERRFKRSVKAAMKGRK